MEAQARLLNLIRTSDSPLLQPQPLEHSQELGDDLPLIRRYVGPRAWYQCVESWGLPEPTPRR